MIQKHIQITKEQNEKLRKKAYIEHVSEAEIIRRCLDKYMHQTHEDRIPKSE